MCRQEPVKCRIFGLRGFLIAAGRIFGISGISVSTEIYFRVVFAKNFPSCVPRAGTPTRRHALGRLPHPAPSARKSVIRLHRKLPSAPLRAPRRFRNPKIGQQLGAQPTPRFRVMIDALLDALLDALARCNVRPMAALHFLPPTGDSRSGSRSFDSKLISLLPLDEVPVHVHPFAARAPCDSKVSECQCGIHTAEAASAPRSRKP